MAILRDIIIISVIMTFACSHSFYTPESQDTNRQDSLYTLHIQDSLNILHIKDSLHTQDSLRTLHIQDSIHTQEALVYDFAPLNIGTKWEYLYYHLKKESRIKDSLNIRIHFVSQQIKGNDTLILLNIRKVGFSIPFMPQRDAITGDVYDTIRIDSQYTDTAIVSDSSISPAPGYRCEVFPFWHKHGIRNDSLSKILLGKDSVNIFKIWGFFGDSIYLKDFGLYSKGRSTCCNTADIWSIKLLSFNDIPIIKDTIFNRF